MAPKIQISPAAHEHGAQLRRTGLIAGTQSSDGSTMHILALLKRPPPSGDVSAISWAQIHSTSVTRMLPGGVDVLGAYTDGTTAHALAECAAIAAAVAPSPALVLTSGMCGRLVARIGSATATTLDVCTAQTAPVRVEAALSLRGLPSAPGQDMDHHSVLAAKRECIARAHQLVARAAFVISKRPVARREYHGALIRDALNWGNSDGQEGNAGTGNNARAQTGVLQGELVLPLIAADAGRDDVRVVNPPCLEPGPRVALNGTLALRAVVQADSTVGEAQAAMREDAIRSLRARAEVIAEADRHAKEDGYGSVCPPAAVRECEIPVRFALGKKEAHNGETLEYAEYALHAKDAEENMLVRAKAVLSWTDAEAGNYEVVPLEEIAPTLVDVHSRAQHVHSNRESGFKELAMNSTGDGMGFDTFRACYFGVVALLFAMVAGLLFRALVD